MKARRIFSEDCFETKLARGIANLVDEMCPDGKIPVDQVAGGLGIYYAHCSIHLARTQAALLLAETLELIIANYREYPNYDLLLQH